MADNMYIKNAGLVLISSYYPMLFERLELTSGSKFISTVSQLSAVNYLQYVATGSSHVDQVNATLNKVLCGINPSQTAYDKIYISEAEIKIINGMLQAVIGHWTAIGESSIEGFRGNWLVRDGVLKEEADKWTLVVEKRAYDLLIQQSPFSFNKIAFPWMNKPLHVEWPY